MLTDSLILFRKYSANQKVGSFHYVHKTPFGNYSFVCADATLTPGPKRPYNFFGILNQVQPSCSWEHKYSVTSPHFSENFNVFCDS